jgi:hypothetical protein
MSAPRVVATLLAIILGAAVISLLPGAQPASADGPPSGSAVTVSGTGDFASLKVTVSQTKNLISQTVQVSWTGGAPTPFGDGTNFLQIMQCWGDDPAGPDRTQCQFGATGLGKYAGRTLQVPNPLNPQGLVDPAELLKSKDPSGLQRSLVPFWPVGGPRPTEATLADTNDFFDSQITNEVPIARTSPNRAGQANFEIETVLQAAGLGCGDPVNVNGTISGRSCWLVIVPRGTTEVNGSPADFRGLQSSALSQTNWNNKIAIHLEFLPQGQTCPLGAPERSLRGHELAVEAVSRWQPALCVNGGSLFSFTQLNDDGARSQLLQATDPGLTLISNPVPPEQQRADRPLVYAPVALSGLAFAFRIVQNPTQLPDGDLRRLHAGEPFTEMNLTPRLVAKLLTQSYQGAILHQDTHDPEVAPNPPTLLPSANPWGLTNDPEFLDLNHGYRDLLRPNLPLDVLVQLGTSDLTGRLWDWVLADPDARAFIEGTPDPSGMVVNQANKGLRPPLYAYPRNDLGCILVHPNDPFHTGKTTAPFCNEDAHQFANDMHQAARAAGRGDPLGGNKDAGNFNADGSNVSYGKAPRQAVTDQALIAVVDTATADRYGLQTAKLRNAAGQFVAPDDTGLRTGAAAMKRSAVPGVLQPDPATKNAAAYPLTSLSYAVTSPPVLTQDAGRDYAKFLRYAVGAGQQPGDLPGQLPLGYVPLPDPLRQQALAAATIIETQAGKSLQPPAPPAAANGGTTPNLGGPAAPNTSQPGGTSPNTAPVRAPGTPGVSQQGAAPSPGATSRTAPGPATVVARRTPALSAPAVGALLLTILISGALAAASSPVLLSPVVHRLLAALPGRLRRGVTPTEQ